jgi:hypothetical protein
MKQEDILLQKCLQYLEALPSIQASLKESSYVLGNGSFNGLLAVSSPIKSVDYTYSVVPDITATTAEYVVAYLKRYEEKLGRKILLVTRYLSDPAIERLLEQDIEFIDGAGNIHLNSPAAYVLIRGKRRPKEKTSSIFQITPNILKIIYILLKSPTILGNPPKELARVAGVTSATVSQTLKKLSQLGYLQRQRNKTYQIVNYTKLLERWEMGYVESLRPKLLLGTFTSAAGIKFSETAENIISLLKEESFLIGGELGAGIATSYLHPQGATLHVLDNHRSIAAKLRLKASSRGEIIFLQQFGDWNAFNDVDSLADPLLIHAELMRENDERLSETAERLFDRYIEDRRKNA